jgi:YD repeat-containing protein
MSSVARDTAGRITAMTENVAGTTHTWAFAYDPHGDLITATRDGTTHSYAFDPNGNRTSVDGATEGPTTRKTDSSRATPRTRATAIS